MKTGILTFHRAHNYGAVLQCYALYKVLKKKGHDVEVIDYRQPYIEYLYKRGMIRYANTFVNKLREVKRTVKDHINYKIFRYGNLRISPSLEGNIIPDYEHYVIGSDQVWSSECTSGFDLTYFGEFRRPEGSTLTGYSVSTTVESISKMESDELARHINNFDRISFREKSIAEIAGKASGKDFPVTLDPTLLLNADEWSELYGKESPGNVVIYILPRYSNPSLYEMMKEKGRELADRLGCSLTEIKRGTTGVSDYVRTLASARAVITNSFHGTAFAVIFRKPLYAVSLGDTLDDRYVGLLKEIGADSHIVEPDFNTNEIKDRLIFDESRLENLRRESLDFIPDAK